MATPLVLHPSRGPLRRRALRDARRNVRRAERSLMQVAIAWAQHGRADAAFNDLCLTEVRRYLEARRTMRLLEGILIDA